MSIINTNEITHLANILLNANHPVLMQSEFNSIIKKNRLSLSSIKNIKKNLLKNKIINKVTLRSEGYKDIDRIIIPSLNPSPYHYAISLRNGTYLSHSSAINILGLTQQIPKIIYVNKEQSPKQKSLEPFTQEAIDKAFSNKQRQSKYIFKIENYQIVLLSGKASNNTGVEIDNHLNLPRTCLERTLIDIVVRPRYAGGVFKVLEAFTSSIHDINYTKLISYLKHMDYKYPYHQSIGFYLERAGAKTADLELFSNIGIHYNFYLDYSMASTKFNKSWRIYFPLGI